MNIVDCWKLCNVVYANLLEFYLAYLTLNGISRVPTLHVNVDPIKASLRQFIIM